MSENWLTTIRDWHILIIGEMLDQGHEIDKALADVFSSAVESESISAWGTSNAELGVDYIQNGVMPIHAVILGEELNRDLCHLIRRHRPEAIPVHLTFNRSNREFDRHIIEVHEQRGQQWAGVVETNQNRWKEFLPTSLRTILYSARAQRDVERIAMVQKLYRLALTDEKLACARRIEQYWWYLDAVAQETVKLHCDVLEHSGQVHVHWPTTHR